VTLTPLLEPPLKESALLGCAPGTLRAMPGFGRGVVRSHPQSGPVLGKLRVFTEGKRRWNSRSSIRLPKLLLTVINANKFKPLAKSSECIVKLCKLLQINSLGKFSRIIQW